MQQDFDWDAVEERALRMASYEDPLGMAALMNRERYAYWTRCARDQMESERQVALQSAQS